MDQFKKDAIQATVEAVAAELGCTMIEACTKIQGTAARQGNEALLQDLIDFKRGLIEAL